MERIGLLGGMSLESTVEYIHIIKDEVARLTDGKHSAKIIMTTVDFAEVEKLQHEGDWDSLAKMLSNEIDDNLFYADFIVICANTPHKLVPEIEKNTGCKVLHIADVTAEAIKAKGLKKVALLGTKFTMEEDFYVDRLKSHGLKVITPDDEDRDYIHQVIYDELCKGIMRGASKMAFINIMAKLKERGAEGVILGCTEIPLLIEQEDMVEELVDFLVFDTTRLHAETAARMACE